MGIQELERTSKIQNLSCQDLEDIVGKFEPKAPNNLNFAQHFAPETYLSKYFSAQFQMRQP
jgi:hypothetical protein